MTTFLLTSLALAAAAVALLTRPWWQHPTSTRTKAMNDTTMHDLLRELDGLRDDGTLAADSHAAARAALERRIAAHQHALAEAPRPQARAARVPRRAWAALAALFVAVGIGGYVWLGDPSALAPPLAAAGPAASPAQPEGAPHDLGAAQIAAMVERLAKRLEAKPDDVEGWAMLARSYAVAGDHAKAVPAFRKAAALRSDDAVLLTDFADALAMVQQRSLEGEPLRLVERALEIDPGNLKALSLAGTAAFNRRDYAGAIRFWQHLQGLAPQDNVFVAQVRGGIEEARQLAAAEAAERGGAAAAVPVRSGAAAAAPARGGDASPAPAPAGAKPAARVSGTVTLAPALAARAAPEDTLFVFARAAEGGQRMPLAILRKQVKDLPLAFTLDDSLAMSPQARLSGQQRVVVAARISRQGQAVAAPGDLQGQSPAVALGASDVRIVIAETVPR